MPTTLLIIYRILGAALFALAAAAIVEKYRTVRGAALLPARVLECRKAASTSPNRSAGGYRYLVELHANGQRLELETNDSFWFKHDKTVGKAIQVWYNPNARCVERKSWETEIFSAVLAVIGAADTVRAEHGMDIICSVGAGRGGGYPVGGHSGKGTAKKQRNTAEN